jgi:hypothetical protein
MSDELTADAASKPGADSNSFESPWPVSELSEKEKKAKAKAEKKAAAAAAAAASGESDMAPAPQEVAGKK